MRRKRTISLFCLIVLALALPLGCTLLEPSSGSGRSPAQGYNERGMASLDNGNYDAAIADFNTAISLDPNLALAYSGRGTAYWHKGNYDQTYLDSSKALDLDPNNSDARTILNNVSSRASANAKRTAAQQTSIGRLDAALRNAPTLGPRLRQFIVYCANKDWDKADDMSSDYFWEYNEGIPQEFIDNIMNGGITATREEFGTYPDGWQWCEIHFTQNWHVELVKYSEGWLIENIWWTSSASSPR